MKKATNETISPTTRVTTPKTVTLATSTRGRRGTAEKVARIVPVLYSALITRIPSTPMASWAKSSPDRLDRVGSNVAFEASERLAHRDACAEVTMAPEPIPTTAVARIVQTVERTVVNLVHSEPSTPLKPVMLLRARRCSGVGHGRGRRHGSPALAGAAGGGRPAKFQVALGGLHERLLE